MLRTFPRGMEERGAEVPSPPRLINCVANQGREERSFKLTV